MPDVKTHTVEINAADIGFHFTSSSSEIFDAAKHKDEVLRNHRWLVHRLPESCDVCPLLLKSVEFPKFDYGADDEAIVKVTYYDEDDADEKYRQGVREGKIKQPKELENFDHKAAAIEARERIFAEGRELDKSGIVSFTFGTYIITMLDETGEPLKIGSSGARLNKFTVTGLDDTRLLHAVTLPPLDYTSSELYTISFEYYVGGNELGEAEQVQ